MDALHVPAQTGEVANIGGDHVRVLISTPGIGVFEETTDPGQGPPLHIHRDADEIFHILAGCYRFRVGEQTVLAGPGDTLVAPKGAPHCFINTAETPGKMFIVFQPGGAETFFTAFAEQGLKLPEDMERVIALGQQHNLEFVGPNPLMD